MGLRFKHGNRSDSLGVKYFFGFMFYDPKQPTLDIIVGKHIFIFFWVRKNLYDK